MSDDDWARVTDALRGPLSPGEQAALDAWLDADPERRAAYESLRAERGRDEARLAPSEAESREMWAAIEGQMDTSDGDGHPSRVTPARPTVPTDRAPRRVSRRPTRSVRALPVAFATALVAAGAWFATAPLRTDASGPRTWATGPGENATVPLADGSVVRLASRTTLTRTDPESRAYTLTGAARFEVARDAVRPFTVETSHGTARVLGTVFSVQAAEADTGMAVSVEEGSVAVRSAGASGEVVLVAGEIASARAGEAPVLVAAATPEVAAAPEPLAPEATVSLRFDGEPLSEVVTALSQVHSVRIEVEGAGLATLPVAADFTDFELDEALGLLGGVLDLDVQTRGSRVVLTRFRR
ncbi:MAG: FecR domain-containing protein [Bacteroidota bacterium]